MIEKLATDYDHNYIKENQFQENLFLLLKFLNLYCKCLKAYVHESFYYPLVMSAVIPTELYFTERSHICWDDGRFLMTASLYLPLDNRFCIIVGVINNE
ncbi:hypothetical protein [Nodularia spumigena]|uniref:Uncharacterized protein n=1 Tax=Nodularia spumigena UHCC 0060 TaxID=3110300 RepID=A0ABU5UYQ4_NODSP|nr:hypothetical protein [Nodularia spumigena]MEA5527962.1 hypothetical protein [Nodularia spumigena UHCC 0143]MEA5610650.1 hypothetical protein [Nodularia spumigena UHCC 0060]